MNEDLLNGNQVSIKLETKQDAEYLQAELIEKKNQIIDDAPKLSLAIKKAPYYLDMLFEQDGTPKYDFRISDRFRKKVSLALKHPHQDTKTGQTYYGEIWTSGYHKRACPNEYLIQVTPTFLSDEELKSIPFGLIKRIGNVEIELVPPLLQDNVSFPDIVKEYIDGIQTVRKRIKQIDEIISEIEGIKSKLPMGMKEVTIEQSDTKSEIKM